MMTETAQATTANGTHANAARAKESSVHTREIVAAANDILTQGLELLFDLDDYSYSRLAGDPFHTSIGLHYRQALDRFVSLAKGLPSGVVDYEDRLYSSRVEREVTFASIATCDILRVLKRCTDERLRRPCEVIFSNGSGSTPSSFTSTVGREIAYCIGAAIHHYGVIRLLSADLGLSIPETFGVAPVALQYHSAAD